MPYPVTTDNWTLVWGEPVSRVYLVVNSDGTAVNLSGYSVRCQFREFVDSHSVLFSPSVVVSSPATIGQVTMTMTPAQTRSLKVASFHYDIVVDNGSGNVLRIAKGKVTVDLGVTR